MRASALVVAVLSGFLALAAGCTKRTTVVQPAAPTPAAAPVLTAVVPGAGPPAGGTAVTLTGSEFQTGATVSFGTAAATGVVFVSATELTAVTPAGSAGAVTVTVTNPGGKAGALGGAYTYAPPPVITGVTPLGGSSAGGTILTITGAGFQLGATVSVGGSWPASMTVVSPTTITATVPAGTHAAVVAVTVTNPDGQSATLASAFTYDDPPVITTSLTPFQAVHMDDIVPFTVTATDPNGDAVHLRLLNPPPGCAFDPVAGVASPGAVTVRWVVRSESQAITWLWFEAYDALVPGLRRRLVVPVRVAGVWGGKLATADVTGDGVLDTVSSAMLADVGGTADAGAVYVWAGQATPAGSPTATLRVPGIAAADSLSHTGFQCADVTGDGTLDLVVHAIWGDTGGTVDTGAIYVWAGGANLAGTVSPTATLRVPNAGAGDYLGTVGGPGFLCVDLTADGVLDVVAAAYNVDFGGTADTGAAYVWAGGSGLAGTVSPVATLRVAGAVANDRLGAVSGVGLQVADVTGDGTLDLVIGASAADVGGTVDAGAVYVWAGGSSLTGTVSPAATLRVPGAVTGDALGTAVGRGIKCLDVTGDGTVDVVVGTYLADVGGVTDAGAVYVWAGGSGLTGTVSPTATLRVAGAVASDQLGACGGESFQGADVTGDGILDLVVGACLADIGGTTNTGAVYVWAGGAGLTGTVSPTATLRVAGATANDLLGTGSLGRLIVCADVTGDGTLDVVVSAPAADIGGTVDTGAVYVWVGGTGLTGTVSPTATLRVSGAAASDKLGYAAYQGIHCIDVTGNGKLDIVVGTTQADIGGTTDTGAVYVWTGGAGLTGTVSPTATLRVSGAAANDKLGDSAGPGIDFADLTGDGTPDVVVTAPAADIGGTTDTGAVYVWAGGAGLTGTVSPTATLRVAGAAASDGLGGFYGVTVLCVDATGDGTLDVVAEAVLADIGGTTDTGAVYVWAGGTGLTGTVSPTATLRVAGATASDQLGSTYSQPIQCADVTGDGVLEVLAATRWADIGGTSDTGAIYLWSGGAALTGTVSPAVTFAVPGAASGDRLGE